jgi:hypothetical protein
MLIVQALGLHHERSTVKAYGPALRQCLARGDGEESAGKPHSNTGEPLL